MATREEKNTERGRQAEQHKDSSREKKSQPRGRSSHENKSESQTKQRAGASLKTTDHDTIRKWVEERGGAPATVKSTAGKSDPGLLRIDFPGRGAEDTLEKISWEEFFDKFEEKKLAFLYQEQTAKGETSRFSKFVSRDE